MTDSLGHRMKFGVIAPSTNTSVQPEFDSMRPFGVTNHFSRIHIPDDPVHSDEDFDQLMHNIRAELMVAIDRVMTCSPGNVIMGMSAETFWDGLDGSVDLPEELRETARACRSRWAPTPARRHLRRYGDIKRISVITPYMPIGDEQVHGSSSPTADSKW